MFKSKLRLRSQLLIDARVQLPFMQRAALYVATCTVYFMVILFFSESSKIDHESPLRSVRQCFDVFAAWAPGLTMLAPIIAYDILIFTHRFAGPMFRLRREMRRLVDHESESPILLRENDHWLEMADLFNELREELITLRESHNPTQKQLFNAGSETGNAHDELLGNLDSGNVDTTPLVDSNQKSEADDEPAQESVELDSIEPSDTSNEPSIDQEDPTESDQTNSDDGELTADELTEKMFANM